MPDVHLKYSPSASARWLACPASLLHSGDSGGTSAAAEEGTAAHELCQRCWILGVDPRDYLGATINGFVVDEEMVEGTQLFLDTIEATLLEIGAPASAVRSEVFIQSPTRPDFGGTMDILIQHDGRTVVIDYKFGHYPVSAIGNSQLLCYAVLATRGQGAVDVVIVQPRGNHPEGPVRRWSIPEGEVVAFAVRVFHTIEKGPDETYAAGDHCRFCPRKLDCPELHQLTIATAKEDFDEKGMTPERASEILAAQKAVRIYQDAVAEYVKRSLENGVPIPGFKLVNAFGNRRFAVDEETIVKRCRAKRFGKKQIFVSSLMSPAQLEKVVGKELVGSLVERPLKGTTVVPESDKRPAIVRESLADSFKDVE